MMTTSPRTPLTIRPLVTARCTLLTPQALTPPPPGKNSLVVEQAADYVINYISESNKAKTLLN